MLLKMYPQRFCWCLTLLVLLSFNATSSPYYVVNTNPWNQAFNDSAMNHLYGPGNWTLANYSTPANTIFAATTPFVMLEGSDGNANALNSFLSANQTTIENWVTAGGRLFINAAPNQGGNINLGFGGTTLVYPNYYVSGGAINPNDSIFIGPFTPVAMSYTGNYLGHAYITGTGLDSLMHGDSTTELVLAKKNWGAGTVFFGGLTQPNWWSPMLEGENLWYNIFNAAETPTTPNDTGALDSFYVYASNNCSPLQLVVKTVNYYPGMSVKTFFGDNTSDSSTINAAAPSGGSAIVNHAYTTTGSYTIKQLLYNGATLVDSLEFSYLYQVCNTLLVSFYYDGNNNCIQDATEGAVLQPSLTEVDSNNVPIDTISATSGFYYTEYGNVGDVYKFKPISVTGYTVSCPATGWLIDTLNIGNTGNLNFGVNCAIGNSFDLSVDPVLHGGTNMASVSIDVNNAYCSSKNAVVTVNYSPHYDYSYSNISPATNNGQTVTWNINGVSNNTPGYIYLYLLPSATPPTVGDTANYSIDVTPVTGDTDATNNTVIIVDTIFGPYDPNYVNVAPQGYISAGTQLKYSVGFENTGNAPALNIHVLDTLPDQVDVNSLRMQAASARMYTSVYHAGGHNIIKFDFPGINLPDSVHNPHNCTGMFAFTIKTKTGLAVGTHIPNKVGIYFDNNEVVMTNTVTNIIGAPVNANTIAAQGSLKIYPNPANDLLTIKTAEGSYSSFTITNSMGQVLMQQQLGGTTTNINIKSLPSGVYYINLVGNNGTETKKFVKL